MATVNTVVKFDEAEIKEALFEKARRTLKQEESSDGVGCGQTIEFETTRESVDSLGVRSATITFHRQGK